MAPEEEPADTTLILAIALPIVVGCCLTLCVVLIVHYTIDGMDLLFSLSASIVYLFGIVYLLLDQKNRTYLRFQCFKKPKWHELKSEEL